MYYDTYEIYPKLFLFYGFASPKFHRSWLSANFIHVLWHLWNIKCSSQLLHNKVISQRRISNNTKASLTKIWPHNKLCISVWIMHICVISWSRCVVTGKHRYCTPNDKLNPHWHTYQTSENKLQPFLHIETKFGVALMNTFFPKYFFKHSSPISPAVLEIKLGVRGSYAAEKPGHL